jgi:hypothetical protein
LRATHSHKHRMNQERAEWYPSISGRQYRAQLAACTGSFTFCHAPNRIDSRISSPKTASLWKWTIDASDQPWIVFMVVVGPGAQRD